MLITSAEGVSVNVITPSAASAVSSACVSVTSVVTLTPVSPSSTNRSPSWIPSASSVRYLPAPPRSAYAPSVSTPSPAGRIASVKSRLTELG